MREPMWLGRWFSGDSWLTWQAILKAAFALPMTADDLIRFHAVAGDRHPPRQPVRELWVIAGRRSGKDSVASALATFSAVFNTYSDKMRPGEKATVVCVAVDRTQARIVHKYISGYFREIPVLRQLVVSDQDESLELNNSVEIIVSTNSFRSTRGRTYAMAILDECGFWRSEESANPDREVYEALLPGFATLDDDGAMLVGITTPYQRSGLAYEKWERHFAQDDDDVLVVHGPSTTFNPTLPQRVIDAALARDPERARAEWLAEWRDIESSFLPTELILAAVDPGVITRPREGYHYIGFVDAAGGAGSDGFTAAICHQQDRTVILDALHERTPPFSPQDTVAEIAGLLREYGIYRISGDRYAGDWPAEAFRRHGVSYEPSKLSRSEIYQETIPLFTSGRVRLLDHKKLVDQFAGLRRKVQPGGREDINHPPAMHDDLCNAAAGALVNTDTKKAPMLVSDEVLARSRIPRRLLGRIQTCF